MGRRHQVDVQRPLGLQVEAEARYLLRRGRGSPSPARDGGILAIGAAQRAEGKEDGAAARLAADGRLLPMVQRRPRHEGALGRRAGTHLAGDAVGPATPRAQRAAAVGRPPAVGGAGRFPSAFRTAVCGKARRASRPGSPAA